ncbi:hypothetical protein EVAR_6816_1 [Eumeta japonica]|uniref:Uncharacterized protein n=1 Tax=Eumeta variegata TaxID=151549 RepID=A0A4C1U7C6_EUMVA|nr:hypothetical protein EVAR_6816_1 [Eumeta japonica]
MRKICDRRDIECSQARIASTIRDNVDLADEAAYVDRDTDISAPAHFSNLPRGQSVMRGQRRDIREGERGQRRRRGVPGGVNISQRQRLEHRVQAAVSSRTKTKIHEGALNYVFMRAGARTTASTLTGFPRRTSTGCLRMKTSIHIYLD